jgi:hypothetical protein
MVATFTSRHSVFYPSIQLDSIAPLLRGVLIRRGLVEFDQPTIRFDPSSFRLAACDHRFRKRCGFDALPALQ